MLCRLTTSVGKSVYSCSDDHTQGPSEQSVIIESGETQYSLKLAGHAALLGNGLSSKAMVSHTNLVGEAACEEGGKKTGVLTGVQMKKPYFECIEKYSEEILPPTLTPHSSDVGKVWG